MDNGIQSPNLPRTTTSESLLVNSPAGTSRQTVQDFAMQLVASEPMRLATMIGNLYDTASDLPATTEQVTPWVYADPDKTKIGIYKVSGGNWVWALPLPYSLLKAQVDDGDAVNARRLVTTLPVYDGVAVIIPVVGDNTTSPVTVSFDGGVTWRTIKTAAGADVPEGGLTAGMKLIGIVQDTTIHLVSDASYDAVMQARLTATEQAKIDAETAASNAATSETNAFGFKDDAATAAGEALATLELVKTAAEAGGDVRIFDTYEAASLDLETISDQQVVEILIDENYDGDRIRYRKESGALVFKRRLDQTGDQIVERTYTPDADLAAPTVIRNALDRRLDVESFRSGSLTDTVVLQRAISAAVSKKVPLRIPARQYVTSASGWLVDLTGVEFLCIEAEGAEIVVSDQGIRSVGIAAAHQEIQNLKLTRSSQAAWGQAKTALLLKSGAKVRAKDMEVSRFTDGLTFEGTSDAPIKYLDVVYNELYLLGEEPIVVRNHVETCEIGHNRASRHLGDGILIKGAQDVLLFQNRIIDACQLGDADYSSLTAGSESNPALPLAGGGLTSNNENNTTITRRLRAIGNITQNTDYGLAFEAAESYTLDCNQIENSLSRESIYVSGTATNNPSLAPQKEVQVINNTVLGVAIKAGLAGWPSTVRSGIHVNPNAGILTANSRVAGNIVVPGASEGAVVHNGLYVRGKIACNDNLVEDYATAYTFLDGVHGDNYAGTEHTANSGYAARVWDDNCVKLTLNAGVPVQVDGARSKITVDGTFTGSATGAAIVQSGAANNTVDVDCYQPNNSSHITVNGDTAFAANQITVLRNSGTSAFRQIGLPVRIRGTATRGPALQLSRVDIGGSATFDIGCADDGAAPGIRGYLKRSGASFDYFSFRYSGLIQAGAPFRPGEYTVATLPDALTYTHALIYVSNGNAGAPCLAFSNGTNWLRLSTGAAVAAS